MLICANGHEGVKGARFCRKCGAVVGAPLEKMEPQATDASKSLEAPVETVAPGVVEPAASSGPRRRRVLIVGALVIAVALIAGWLVIPSSDTGASASAVVSFKSEGRRGLIGVAIIRRWTITGDHGDHLDGVLVVRNQTKKLMDIPVTEAIPKSLAKSAERVIFRPAVRAGGVLQADPIVRWRLHRVAAGGSRTLRYGIRIPAGRVDGERADRWRRDQDLAFDAACTDHPDWGACRDTMTSLGVTPNTPQTIGVGTALQFQATANFAGDAKPLALTSGVGWKSSHPEIAVVDPTTGVLLGVGPGTTQVTATYLGTTSTPVAVTVDGSGLPTATTPTTTTPTNSTTTTTSPTNSTTTTTTTNTTTSTTKPGVPPVTGDINGDRLVGCKDMAILRTTYGSSGQNLPADINHDGTVNLYDLSIMLSHWTGDGTTAPEWQCT